MNMNEFAAMCGNYLIEPAIALENNNVVELLLDIRNASSDNAKSGYRNLLIRILETQF